MLFRSPSQAHSPTFSYRISTISGSLNRINADYSLSVISLLKLIIHKKLPLSSIILNLCILTNLLFPHIIILLLENAIYAAVVEQVDTRDLKSLDRNIIPVRFRSAAPKILCNRNDCEVFYSCVFPNEAAGGPLWIQRLRQ